jgi:imidazolonepropionase-like amidohydrolase
VWVNNSPFDFRLEVFMRRMTCFAVLISITLFLAAACSTPATVETGKSADFIVLDANPLDDITNKRKIDSVYLHGGAVDRAALSAQWTGQNSQ